MQALQDNSASDGQAVDQQQSIYAQNRAVYEASLNAAQSGDGNASGANGGIQSSLPGFSFNPSTGKHSRPRSNSPERPPSATVNGNTSPQQPARKKLVKAGDVEARNGSQEPGTPLAENGAAPPSAGMSMREQLARARLPGNMAAPSPTAVQYQQNGQMNTYAMQQQQQQPAYSPPPQQVNVNAQPGQQMPIESIIEQNAQAFIAKNPQVSIEIVRGALKHSRGVFDSNFHQALQVLMQQAQKANLSNSNGAGTPTGSQPATPRYPGQQTNPNPAPQGNYPGFNSYQGQQQQPQQSGRPQQQQQLHPHQMQPGASAQNINGHSAAALGSQRFFPGQSQSPAGATQQLPQQLIPAPPPVLVGTHMEIGFSALQVLPKEQHNQFLQLAPSQQTAYSLQVFQSLNPAQQAEFSARHRQLEEQRRLYYAQQSAQGALSSSTGPGRQGTPQNPYIGYASQMPTAQQQQQQQRFPGQNPVFRVGAPAGGQQQVQYQQQHVQQQQQQHPSAQGLPNQVSQPEFMANQQRILLEQMNPQQREQFYNLAPQQQQQWVWSQVQARQEHQRRQQAMHQRNKQQQMMAKSVQAAKAAGVSGQAQPGSKKRRRKAGSDDDDSGDLGLHDEDTDDDRADDDVDGPDGSEAEEEREAKAIVWFNNCKKEELMEMTGQQQPASPFSLSTDDSCTLQLVRRLSQMQSSRCVRMRDLAIFAASSANARASLATSSTITSILCTATLRPTNVSNDARASGKSCSTS